ncbi:uncharacterized protein si:dkey-27h10.2 isoform X1 [Eleginops maclovinus]|uniref:uncharacterized protein si:dkey-27h10.2 isoform X1 n=1 Tax=Eleginops maclovinus TaxID=56733 RepID=UPI0030806246
MPSLRLFFYIIGLVVVSETAPTSNSVTVTTLITANTTDMTPANSDLNSTTVTTLNTPNTSDMTGGGYNILTTTSQTTANVTPTTINSTMAPKTNLTSTVKGGNDITIPDTPMTTPKAMVSKKPMVIAPDEKKTPKPIKSNNYNTGIIILVVIILVAVAFGVACFIARKRARRYSVDFTSRPDEANIPLSTMEPDFPVDAAPQNSLQTFESAETTTKELQKPEAKPEVQEEQKAEADKPVEDPGESAALVPSPDSAEDKPKDEVVEQSPPPLVELSLEEKTDDEGVVSNKTSLESLKETNENNSNSADFSQKRDLKKNNIFWDSPV